MAYEYTASGVRRAGWCKPRQVQGHTSPVCVPCNAFSLSQYCRHHIALGELFAELVRKDDRFEIITPPRFALTCFVVKVRTSVVTHTLPCWTASPELVLT